MVLYIPSKQRVMLVRETTAGTTPTITGASTTASVIGPVQTCATEIIGTPYEENAYLGYGVTHVGSNPTARTATISWSEVARSDSLSMFVLMSMLGGGSDTKTGATPFVHTGQVTKTLPSTWSVCHDTGQAADILTFPYATGTQVAYACSPTTALTASVTMSALPGTVQAAPYLNYATVASRSLGYNTTAVLATDANNTTSTPLTSKIISCSLTFTRAADVIITSGSANATDVSPGPLMMSGSLELLYDGAHVAATAYKAWLTWQTLGYQSGANVNSFTWNPDSGTSTIAITWGPMIFSRCALTEVGNAMHVSVDFQCFNDLGTLNQITAGAQSGTATAPISVVANNPYGTSPLTTMV